MTRATHLRFAGLQKRSIAAYHLALQPFLAFAKYKYQLKDPLDLGSFQSSA